MQPLKLLVPGSIVVAGLCVVTAAGAGAKPTSQSIAFSSKNDIYVVNVNGRGLRQLTRDPKQDYWPSWSPDGRKIAFASDRSGQHEVYVMNADGTGLHDLTGNLGGAGPAWSPDGKQIAFTTDRDGNAEVYVMNADGSHPRNLTNNPARDSGPGFPSPAWSPDGKQIAFTTDRDGNDEIYMMNADGSDQRNLSRHRGDDVGPAWSPSWKIAFASDRNGAKPFDVEVMNADGSGQRDLGAGYQPAWSPDGSELVFTRELHPGIELFVMNAAGGALRQLTHTHRGGSTMAAWQPATPKG